MQYLRVQKRIKTKDLVNEVALRHPVITERICKLKLCMELIEKIVEFHLLNHD